MNELLIYTSFVSPRILAALLEREILPVFIIRNIKNSDLIGKYSDTSIHLKDLAPSNQLYHEKRDGIIDFEEFKKRYLEEIKKFTPRIILGKLLPLSQISNCKAIAMLSYGSDKEHCHRTILAEYLNQSGLLANPVKELEWTRIL